jgi:5-methyltetrahydropteroyltriglutamate--homocysteine methyltransferase
MKRSTGRIRTTHTGSLPRPKEILVAMRAMAAGQDVDRAEFDAAVTRHVGDIVRRQVEAGIDTVNDGECGKVSFFHYIAERVDGYAARVPPGGLAEPTGPLNLQGRDARMFPDYYQGVVENNPFASAIRATPQVCVGPLRYVGHERLQRDISNLKAAMEAAGAEEGFMPSSGPFPIFKNEFYKTDEEYVIAYGEAMREEYKAILDAGLLLQVDVPQVTGQWDSTDGTMADYRKWVEQRIEALNHALRGLPEERIRFHTCFGVNFGPRVSDLQLADIIDLIFTIRAGAYSFEAANPRHEHEWNVTEKAKLPDGKILIPGAVTHSNVMVEHPQGIAERMERWARAAGRENVIFGNDCGFQSWAGNSEIPMTVAWAKLQALGDGARIASQRLWN